MFNRPVDVGSFLQGGVFALAAVAVILALGAVIVKAFTMADVNHQLEDVSQTLRDLFGNVDAVDKHVRSIQFVAPRLSDEQYASLREKIAARYAEPMQLIPPSIPDRDDDEAVASDLRMRNSEIIRLRDACKNAAAKLRVDTSSMLSTTEIAGIAAYLEHEAHIGLHPSPDNVDGGSTPLLYPAPTEG